MILKWILEKFGADLNSIELSRFGIVWHTFLSRHWNLEFRNCTGIHRSPCVSLGFHSGLVVNTS